MDHIAAAEEQIVTERMKRKFEEVNAAAQSQLSPIQDHINFTLQQAYFKCAYECFDRSRKQEEIANCVERCSLPVVNAQQHFEGEMAQFQERMNRSLMVCQDKFEAAKLHQNRVDAVKAMESCVNRSTQDNLDTLPHIVQRMKTSFSIVD
ncbi:PREDICTED: protein FAM136A-like [Camelina sativa]|uniref:Protein FAM136A-like n=1 Tax=Camelina sativa TaxID=90675 RepID=A0ABM0VKP6_CAMSA|nr:PREDICTED: protein FAM136A-like [Camelina sativa]